MPWWIILIVVLFLIFDGALTVWILARRFRQKKFSGEERQYILSHWIRIIDSFSSHPAQAILDADKLLDYALSRKGFNGNTGEKLKAGGNLFDDLNGVWFAHKLRNQVAHEMKEINFNDAKRGLSQFKRALNNLGADL